MLRLWRQALVDGKVTDVVEGLKVVVPDENVGNDKAVFVAIDL
jgi:hypothetical protein